MKIGTVLFLAGLGAAQAILQSSETCVDVWAHDDEDNMATCAEKIGADYWGWTNGRYGIGQCEPCDCPECPPVEAPTKAPTPTPVPLPQKCIGISGSFSGGKYCTVQEQENVAVPYSHCAYISCDFFFLLLVQRSTHVHV